MHHKTYCKVCADSKKPMSVITSHNVRNLKNGAITCPTLLEQSCRQCGQRGHTVSRCKQIQKAEEPDAKKTKRNEPASNKLKTSRSAFEALMSDSEDEQDQVEDAKEVTVCVPAKPLLTGYASALKTTNAINVTLRKQLEDNYTITRGIPKPVALVKTVKDPNRPFSWADCDSCSEGSDEEEDDN